MIGREWYKARIRWAEMVEGYGIRNWEEGLYLYRSENRETRSSGHWKSEKVGRAAARKKTAVERDGSKPAWLRSWHWTAWVPN